MEAPVTTLVLAVAPGETLRPLDGAECRPGNQARRRMDPVFGRAPRPGTADPASRSWVVAGETLRQGVRPEGKPTRRQRRFVDEHAIRVARLLTTGSGRDLRWVWRSQRRRI